MQQLLVASVAGGERAFFFLFFFDLYDLDGAVRLRDRTVLSALGRIFLDASSSTNCVNLAVCRMGRLKFPSGQTSMCCCTSSLLLNKSSQSVFTHFTNTFTVPSMGLH
jgi:hypothetical protein